MLRVGGVNNLNAFGYNKKNQEQKKKKKKNKETAAEPFAVIYEREIKK